MSELSTSADPKFLYICLVVKGSVRQEDKEFVESIKRDRVWREYPPSGFRVSQCRPRIDVP